MSPSEYVVLAGVTESRELIAIQTRSSNCPRLIHALLGIGTESGELQDVLKRYLIYGKDIDIIHLKEELGDLLWYIALALDEIETSFEEVFESNIAKLQARYPDKFTEIAALNRDLRKEREALDLPRIR